MNSSRGSTSREKKAFAKLKVTTPAQQLSRLYKSVNGREEVQRKSFAIKSTPQELKTLQNL